MKKSFDLQLFADIPLPVNPSTNLALPGRAFLVYIDTGAEGSPDWLLIGGQRGVTRNLEGTNIDTSNKGDDGWGSAVVGLLNWSLDLDVMATGNAKGNLSQTVKILSQAFRNRQSLHVKFEYPDKSYEEGWAYVMTQPIEAPHDDVASLSTTLQGVGPLSELKTDEVAP